MKPIIKVENLSKQYHIGAQQVPYATLRESLAKTFRAPFQRLRRNGQSKDNMFWAIQDVSFEVMSGDVVGVIGRNGAGKSTLLKLISRITEPTVGGIDLYGRVASLLEVGTGFHPELTGRENIYLNGAILGMRKTEIERKLDEIVAFAEIEKFIDTPVKHYSSGMYMRLAFSVAAHLEPEILLVDEVLAVGDAAFQKKCLGKMGNIAKEGRTVVFVSHNMGAISHLCNKGLVLREGQIEFYSNAREAIDFYNHQYLVQNVSIRGRSPHIIYDCPTKGKENDFAITRIEILDATGTPKHTVATWDDVVFRIWYSSKKYIGRGSVVLELATIDGVKLLLLSTQPDGTIPLPFEIGEQYVDCIVERLPFAAGEYVIGAGLAIPNVEWLWRDQELCSLQILPRDIYGSGLAPLASRSLMTVKHEWRTI